MAATLPERIALARRDQLDYASFLEIILADEIGRREHRAHRAPAAQRWLRAGLPASRTSTGLRRSPWTAACWTPSSLWSSWTSTNMSCSSAPAGVGKSFLAQALGYTAIRAGHTVRFIHADDFFKAMTQARVDNSVERTFRSFLSPDLLILDDLGLHRLTAQQSADLYELIISRHRVSSFVITSNRGRGGMAQPLRRSHPRQQRPRPARQRQLPNHHRRPKLPREALSASGLVGSKGGV